MHGRIILMITLISCATVLTVPIHCILNLSMHMILVKTRDSITGKVKELPVHAVSVLNDSILVILTSHGNIATINRAFSDEPEVLDTLHVIANGDNVYYSGNVKIQSWYRDRIYLTTNYGIQSVDVSDPANLQYQQEVLVPCSIGRSGWEPSGAP